MADAKRAAHAPAGRDRGERLEDERALASAGCGMVSRRERQLPPLHKTMSRSSTRGPQRRPRRRPKSRSMALRRAQHFGRFQVAFDQRDGIGEIAPGAAMRRVEDDRRGIEQAELLVEPRDRGFDHPLAAAEAPVRAGWTRSRWRRGESPRQPCHCEQSEAIQRALTGLLRHFVLAMTAE